MVKLAVADEGNAENRGNGITEKKKAWGREKKKI